MRRLGLTAIVVCALGRTAHAGYCLYDPPANGTDMRWPGGTVTYKINVQSMAGFAGGAAAARRIVVDAFATWAAATCTSLHVTDGGDSSSTDWKQMETGTILVFFANDDTTWNQSGSDLSAIATTYFWQDTMGHFISAAIMFNAAHFTFSDSPTGQQYDLQGVSMLEIGRMLGLDYNPTSTLSVMHTPMPPADLSRRTLTDDDANGIAYLYPQASPQGACASIPPPAPFNECHPPPGPGGSGGSGGSAGTGGSGGSGGTGGTGGAPTPDAGTGGAANGMDSGCGCTVGAAAGGGAGMTLLALLGTIALCATRRSRLP